MYHHLDQLFQKAINRRRTGLAPAPFKRFAHGEDGGLIIFAMYIFVVMLIVGGLAVDFMRLEANRTRLQNTLDRAILAAADLDQTLDPQSVVEDYFDKAGLSDYLVSVTVDDGLNYRVVSATAEAEVNTIFLGRLGFDTLSAPAVGTAEERISNLEISLILDVSGSMSSDDSTGSQTKLAALQDAAGTFIDTIIEQAEEDTTSFAIIPYATQVTVGENLLDYYTVTDEHSYSNCVDFESDDFDSASLSTTDLLQRTGHFDPWTSYRSNSGAPTSTSLVCRTESSREIMPWNGDATELKDHINNFTAGGNTSIDVAVKWGLAMLDPDSQSIVTDMISESEVDSNFAGRPFDYTDTSGMKVMVVMTDGINTEQYYLNDSYLSGYSDVYVNETDGLRSVLFDQDTDDTSDDVYWWEYDGDDSHDMPYGEGATVTEVTYTQTLVCTGRNRNETCTYEDVASGGDSGGEETAVVGEAVRQTFPELWDTWSISGNAYYNYYAVNNSSSDYNDWNDEPYSYVGSSTKDTRLNSICSAAKDQGVLVFTIGFEVTDDSAEVLEDCASSASHFFRVEGLEIDDAFTAIATSINQLKLTQ